MGWTSPRTWVAGEKPTAATMNTHIRDNLFALNGFALKTANQGFTSTGLVNDNELVIAIGSPGTYLFEAFIAASSSANAAGDLKIGAIWPTAVVHQFGWSADPGLATGSVQTGEWKSNLNATSGTTIISYGLSTAPTTIFQRWLIVAAGTGNFRIQAGQVSGPTGTSTILAGSHVTMKAVA